MVTPQEYLPKTRQNKNPESVGFFGAVLIILIFQSFGVDQIDELLQFPLSLSCNFGDPEFEIANFSKMNFKKKHNSHPPPRNVSIFGWANHFLFRLFGSKMSNNFQPSRRRKCLGRRAGRPAAGPGPRPP